MFVLIVTIVVLLIILVKSADLLEDAFVAISQKYNINVFLTGFVILGIASSLPETSVAINSIFEKAPALSVGNLLGSTTVVLTFIIGLNAIKHKSMPFRGFFRRREVVLALGVIIAQVAAVFDGEITPLEGIILITLYFVFVLYIIFKSNKVVRKIKIKKIKTNLPLLIGKSVVGITALIWSAHTLVGKAIEFANDVHVPQILVGLFMLSVGTNIPEIALLIRSDGSEKESLAAGNFIGSATFNTAILGILAIFSPYQIANFSDIVIVIILLCVSVAVFASIVNDDEITSKEGYLLILLFFVAALVQLFISKSI